MLIELLVLVLVLGLVVELARRFLGEPFRTVVFAVAAIVLLVWLLRFAGLMGRY